MSVRANLPLLSVLLVIGLLIGAAGRVYAQASTEVRIGALALMGSTLTITGRNFGGGTPTVQVDGESAAVSSATETEIIAEIPALAAGTHIVKVMRDSNPGGTALSTLRIR